MTKQLAIWIDHKEARIFHIQPDLSDETTVLAPTHNIHHKHPREGSKKHPDDAKQFFHDVVDSLDGTEQILVVGPSTAKLEFLRYVHKHDHTLEPRIVGIETVDHPTDRQLIAYAKTYFKVDDQNRS